MVGRRIESGRGLVVISGVALLLSGCFSRDVSPAVALLAQLEEAGTETTTLNYSTLAPYEWDQLVIVCSFTSNEEVNRMLGFDWAAAPRIDDDFDHDIVALVSDRSVVAYDLVPPELVLCRGASGGAIEGTRVFERDDSTLQFARETLDDVDPLFLSDGVTEYWILVE